MVSSYNTRKEKRKEKKEWKLSLFMAKKIKGENYHIYSLMVLALSQFNL